MSVIIPARDLKTPAYIYAEFEKIINKYRDRMKYYINNFLQLLPPISLINQCVTIDIEKLIEYSQFCKDDYNFIAASMIFMHYKTEKKIMQTNLIEYVLEDITKELTKLGYNVTTEYSSSSVNNKSESPVSITLKWNHLPTSAPQSGSLLELTTQKPFFTTEFYAENM